MCTAITYVSKDHYFGRNFDYEISYNEVVTITPRNYKFSFREVGNLDHHFAIIGIAAGIADYPLYYDAINEKGLGILVCGSGIGISIACNKVKGVRCAKVTTREETQVTRNDNNSNIVAFGEKTTIEDALAIVTTFINTPFSDLEKHHRRVDKITDYEENN